MVRKRSLSSILNDEENEGSTSRPYAIPSSRQRTRSASNILGEESFPPTPSRIGRLVACNCLECDGRLVDPRTKTIYEVSQNSED